jgi:hypothetical protein
MTRGLPGKRVEAYLDGIITATFIGSKIQKRVHNKKILVMHTKFDEEFIFVENVITPCANSFYYSLFLVYP